MSQKKGAKFVSTDNCQLALGKSYFLPVLIVPESEKCFKLDVDASDIGAGAVCIQ